MSIWARPVIMWIGLTDNSKINSTGHVSRFNWSGDMSPMYASASNYLFLFLKGAQINHNIIHFWRIPPILQWFKVSEIVTKEAAIRLRCQWNFKLPRIILLILSQLQAAFCYASNEILHHISLILLPLVIWFIHLPLITIWISIV